MSHTIAHTATSSSPALPGQSHSHTPHRTASQTSSVLLTLRCLPCARRCPSLTHCPASLLAACFLCCVLQPSCMCRSRERMQSPISEPLHSHCVDCIQQKYNFVRILHNSTRAYNCTPLYGIVDNYRRLRRFSASGLSLSWFYVTDHCKMRRRLRTVRPLTRTLITPSH